MESTRSVLEGLSQGSLPHYMGLAEEAKSKGNIAYAANKSENAVQFYLEAIVHLEHLITFPDITQEERKKAEKLIAICSANQAAAYMLTDVKNPDLEAALEAAAKSERIDPSYVKAYIRQVNALVLLDRKEDAIDVVIRALKKDDLKDHAALVDRLINLLTDGQGFPNNEVAMTQLLLNITMVNERGMERGWDKLRGEWERRVNTHLARVSRRY